MGYNNNFQNDKIEFRTIVLTYLKKIMEINLKVINPNLKVEYVQMFKTSVLGLGDVLTPFYDKEMDKQYLSYEKEYEDCIKKTTKDGVIIDKTNYKILCRQIHRKLFRQLNLLLKRNDYLQQSVYGESDDSDEIIGDIPLEVGEE
jgi:hypothetical protein